LRIIPGIKLSAGSRAAAGAVINSFEDGPVLDSNPARAGVRFNSNHVDLA
jgi:acetyltransferase-like isoleucine patch superfamily enzyme